MVAPRGDETLSRSAGGEPSAKLRVFLSYSRADGAFVRRLSDALTARGYVADFDQSHHDPDNVATGISAEDEWWRRLQDMIAAADVMVFVVSPDSAASAVCDEEIAYARSLSKRVIAILRRPIDFATAPPRLAALNVKLGITADDAPAFDAGVAALATALDRDVTWLREHTRLTGLARAWESGRREDELLRGAEISDAEAWSARRPANAPEVSELLLSFLAESRAAQSAREERERRSLRRQRALQGWVGGLIVVAFAITVAGGWYVIQRQREVARTQSTTLAWSANLFLERNDAAGALRLAVLSARDTYLSPAGDVSLQMLSAAATASPLVADFVGAEGRVTGATLSPDQSQALSWSEGPTVEIWSIAAGELVARLTLASAANGAAFIEGGARGTPTRS